MVGDTRSNANTNVDTRFENTDVASDDSLQTQLTTPLPQRVTQVVDAYFDALEGQLPTNLYDTILKEVEKPMIEVVLERVQGNQSKAAKVLGISRITLRKKMARYGLL